MHIFGQKDTGSNERLYAHTLTTVIIMPRFLQLEDIAMETSLSHHTNSDICFSINRSI